MVVPVVIDKLVGGIGLVDHCGAWLDGLFDIEHMWKNFPVDADLGDRVAGGCLGVGDDGDDGFALVSDLCFRKHRFIVKAEVEQAQKRIEVRGYILAQDHATYVPAYVQQQRCQ